MGTSGALALALLVAGCGLGAGSAPTAVQLLVTSDFGARVLARDDKPAVRGQETVMTLLARNEPVSTRFGGAFVQSVAGLSGGRKAGAPVDWFYYVNGVGASKGASATDVHPGDHVWWDRHDWSQTQSVPAVVGSFPEPFLNGLGGKRWPLRIECAQVSGYACRTVTARLRALGIPAAIAAIGSSGEPETLRLIVGPWASIGGDLTVHTLAAGPRVSGVYARFAANGRTLALLNQNGGIARTLGAGTGLVAATRSGEAAPVWIVTGVDGAGVDAAARDLRQADLRDRFAVAVSGTRVLALPRP